MPRYFVLLRRKIKQHETPANARKSHKILLQKIHNMCLKEKVSTKLRNSNINHQIGSFKCEIQKLEGEQETNNKIK